jgi:hypothetical protein
MGNFKGVQPLFVPDYYLNSVGAIPIYFASRSTLKEKDNLIQLYLDAWMR